MNVQLIANEQDQDRAERGKNEASGMKSLVCRARKHVANAAANDRPDDAEHDGPEERHVHVHHIFCDNARDQPNKYIPDQVKHTSLRVPEHRRVYATMWHVRITSGCRPYVQRGFPPIMITLTPPCHPF